MKQPVDKYYPLTAAVLWVLVPSLVVVLSAQPVGWFFTRPFVAYFQLFHFLPGAFWAYYALGLYFFLGWIGWGLLFTTMYDYDTADYMFYVFTGVFLMTMGPLGLLIGWLMSKDEDATVPRAVRKYGLHWLPFNKAAYTPRPCEASDDGCFNTACREFDKCLYPISRRYPRPHGLNSRAYARFITTEATSQRMMELEKRSDKDRRPGWPWPSMGTEIEGRPRRNP